MVTAVEVRLNGAAVGVPARAYTTVLEQLTYALEEIEQVSHPARGARPTWLIKRADWSAMGEMVIVLAPTAVVGQWSVERVIEPARALVDGVLTLNEVPEIPDGFSEGVLERLGKVRKQVDVGNVQTVTLMSVNGSRSAPAEVSEAVQRNAQNAVIGASTSYGSLVGKLDVISVRRSKRRIGLLPDHGPAVTCVVDQLPHDMVVAFFDQQVVVSGLVRRNSRGQAVRLNVENLELAPRLSPVRAADLVGAIPDLGDGLSVSDYLSRQRAL